MLNIFSHLEPNLEWEHLCEAWADVKNIGEVEEGEEDEFYTNCKNDIIRLPLYQRMALGLTDCYMYQFYSVYRLGFEKDNLNTYWEIIDNLKIFGFVLEEDHRKMLDGTHPIYEEYAKAKEDYENA